MLPLFALQEPVFCVIREAETSRSTITFQLVAEICHFAGQEGLLPLFSPTFPELLETLSVECVLFLGVFAAHP